VGRRGRVGDALRALLLIGLFTIWLVPSFIMISNSLSSDKSFARNPPTILPQRFSLVNYQRVLTLKLLPRWIGTTLLVAVVHVVGGILINGLAGYVFAFSKMRWVRWLFWVFMCPIFVSGYILLVPQYVIMGKLGMIGLPAVILPGMGSTTVFLFRNYFRSIPTSLHESARIDGAGEFLIFRKIVLPLSGPIVGMMMLLGMGSIGGYIWPMLNLRVPETQTYLVGLMASAINVYAAKDVGYDLTLGTMAFLPYLIVFVIANRYFIGGLTLGALRE
jgi:multiple sugar transport system permease protein